MTVETVCTRGIHKPDLGNGLSHPARYSRALIPIFAEVLQGYCRVLDPFAGTGRIHLLQEYGFETIGVEIEPEWASLHPDTICGNALYLPFPDDSFDGVCTSCCLEQSQRILTSDLRWVPVGNIQVGQEVMAFEEQTVELKANGTASRRRWRRAIVTRSIAKRAECVRVILSNGDEIVTTLDHPWLANRYGYCGSVRHEWVPSRLLMGNSGRGTGRGHKCGRRQSYHVLKQLDPWNQETSFDAGWLSGLFDGEGSISMMPHGAPKMQLCQANGSVLDRAEVLMRQFGLAPNKIGRTGVPSHRKQISNLYVTGGFPGVMRALGTLRPVRLLDKWMEADITTRTVEARNTAVTAVEAAGTREIQEIETSEGTYIGEGYLMHNCYGNRLADHHEARDPESRRSYRHDLGRPLSADNAGSLQWGPAYRDFHEKAWVEAIRVLRPGGRFVLNIKDHIRGGVLQSAPEWHRSLLMHLGLTYNTDLSRSVQTPGLRQGENRHLRAVEWVMVFHNQLT